MSNNNTHKRPLDIFIKTRAKDMLTFRQLQQDILKHSRLGGRVYVAVHPVDLAPYQEIVSDEFVLLNVNSMLQRFGYDKELKDNWGTQQIVKLLAAGVVENEQYLILDSNTLLNYDFDESHFCKDDHFLYAIGDWSDRQWEAPAREFLKLDVDGLQFGFRSANQVFLKRNVLTLIRYLEKTYQQNIVELLNSQPEAWTEFKLYGYFCRCIVKDSGHYFQPSSDVTSVNKPKVDVESYLRWLKYLRPLMIKVYKHRPTHQLSDEEYLDFVTQIKLAYRH